MTTESKLESLAPDEQSSCGENEVTVPRKRKRPLKMARVCAGSTGGSRPPHDHPRRLASQCEAVHDDEIDVDVDGEAEPALTRPGRGPARGLGVAARMQQLGGRIPAYFDGEEGYETYKAVGPDYALFTSQFGIEIRSTCDSGRPAWLQVPEDERATVQARMNEMFIINYDNPRALAGLDALAADLYKHWKNRLSKYFKDNGGKDDLARVMRTVPPKNCPNEDGWKSFIDFYSSEKTQKKANTNNKNRKCNPLPTCQGRLSLSQRRNEGVCNPSTQPPTVSAPDACAFSKKRPDGTLAHPDYPELYDKMQQDMTQLTQQQLSQSGDSSTSASPSTPRRSPLDEIAVMESVFKPMRDFVTGNGRRLPKHLRHAGQSSSSGMEASSSRPAMMTVDEHWRQMEELQQQMRQEITAQRYGAEASFRYLADYVRQVVPGAAAIPDDQVAHFFTPLPLPPPPPQPQPQPQQESDDDDVTS